MKRSPTFWVALSGGYDSVALLHLVKTYVEQHSNMYDLQAIHVNHHLLKEADEFQAHCAAICRQLHVPLKIIDVDCQKEKGISLEAKARMMRYSALKKQLKINDFLLTAHHQDDQAETTLLQILRGAGIKGASGMPEIAPLGKGFLLRLLLHHSRRELLDYCNQNHLKGFDDPSNHDQSFDRNFLRAQIFPILTKHWPKAPKIFSRFAHHCAEQMNVIENFSQKDFDHCVNLENGSIKIYKLLLFSLSRQKNILRKWIYQTTYYFPSEKILNEILSFPFAKSDKNPQLKVNGIECHRFQGELWMVPPQELIPRKKNTLSEKEKLWCKKHIKNWSSLKLKISVRFRQGGEKFTPINVEHSKSLKNLFQECQVPPWQRNKIPLIFLRETLIAVVGYAVANIERESKKYVVTTRKT